MKWTFPLVLALLAGCAGAPPASSDEADTADTTDNQSFTRTIVNIAPDGTESVTVNTISQTRLSVRAPSGGLSTNDYGAERTGCDGNATVLYDRVDFSGNQICFNISSDPRVRMAGGRYAKFNVSLANYCVDAACTASWWSRVRSYYNGSSGLYLQGPFPYNGGPYCIEWMSDYRGGMASWGKPYEARVASYCAQNANYLFLSMNVCPSCWGY